MSEECACISYQSQHLIEIVRSRGAVAGLEELFAVYVVQQSKLPIVDQFMFLSLSQRLDGQAQLLFHLVHRLVIQIGYTRMDAQDRLSHAQGIFSWRRIVINKGCWQVRLSLVAR